MNDGRSRETTRKGDHEGADRAEAKPASEPSFERHCPGCGLSMPRDERAIAHVMEQRLSA